MLNLKNLHGGKPFPTYGVIIQSRGFNIKKQSYQLIKTVLYSVFLLLSVFSLKAQENLVPNGSFEEYNWCPNSTDGYYIDACKGWTSATLGGSPDYFNACSTEYDQLIQSYNFSVPENYYGYQFAHEGNAYAGFVFGQNVAGEPTYSEYVQVKLKKELDAGKFYKVRFFINNPRTQSCINSVGALFTSSELNISTEEIIPFVPQILSDTSVFFCDTLNWQEVSGVFQAMGNERYLTIGVFNQLPILKVVDYEGSPIIGPFSNYFLVDNVSVIEMEFNLVIPNVFTPNKDGTNDVYYLDLKEFEAVQVEIYNRWGNIVYQDENILKWDGTYNEKDCPDGIYFIRIQQKNNTINGFIHLIR